MKKTRQLVGCLVAIVICFAMLIGTTYAWFTDSVINTNNIIKSGNIDVELWHTNICDATYGFGFNNEKNEEVGAKTNLFLNKEGNEILWEPGAIAGETFRIKNVGSLALKYQFTVRAVAKSFTDEGKSLTDVLGLEVAHLDYNESGTPFVPAGSEVYYEKFNDGHTVTGSLLPGETIDYLVDIDWVSSANDNDYMNLSMVLGIELVATQLNFEVDGMGNGYDAGAEFPEVPTADYYAYDVESLQNAFENVEDGQVIRFANDVVVTNENAVNNNAVYYTGDKSFTIDLNGYTLTANTSNAGLRFQKAVGGAENTINIINGAIIGGEKCFSAISIGSSAQTKTYVNVSDMEIEACMRNDYAVRARTGSVFTITDCVINATNYGGGVAAGGGEVVMNNVTINQSGLDASAPWNSAAFGISGNGKITINSGSYFAAPKKAEDANNQGTSHGSFVGIIMNSGGTLIINGGNFQNDNFGDNALATAARGLIEADTGAIVEINGGNFTALKSILAMTNNLGDASRNPSATLAGGVFSADPTVSGLYASHLIKVKEGFKLVSENGIWSVVAE